MPAARKPGQPRGEARPHHFGLTTPCRQSSGLPTVLDLDQYLVHYMNNGPIDSWLVAMHISVSSAKAHLTDLVRRAEAGDEVVLTRHGQPAVRLIAIKTAGDRVSRRRILEAARQQASQKAVQGPAAARSQDFLYDDDGLPG